MNDKIPETTRLNMLQKKLVQHIASRRAAIRIANEILEAEQFRTFSNLTVESRIVAAWLLRIRALGQFFGENVKPLLGDGSAYLQLVDTKEEEIGKPIDCGSLDGSTEFAEQIASQLYAGYEDEILQKAITGRKNAWAVVVFRNDEEQARWRYSRHHGEELCGETDPVQAILALAKWMSLYDRETGKRHKEYVQTISSELTMALEGDDSVNNGF